MNWLHIVWWLTVYLAIIIVSWQAAKVVRRPEQQTLKVRITSKNIFDAKQ